ncbi:MAG: hypothetical protein K2N29_01095, partial [Ruminiclostridium sp.]|nr:hypothetical protein [Ruminiclostridium sp.]
SNTDLPLPAANDTAANDASGIMPMNENASAEIADEDGILYFAEDASEWEEPSDGQYSGGRSCAAETTTVPAAAAFTRELQDQDAASAAAAAQDNAADEMQEGKSVSGGDELALYYGLSDPRIARIDGGLIDIVGEEAFVEWQIGEESAGCTTDLSEEMNLYALILDFPQYKAAMEARLYELVEIDRANGWTVSLNEEEIELLLNGEKDAVSAYFTSPAAVYQDGKIYSPEWLDTHTVADYEAENLPKDQLREKLDEILWLSNFIDLTSLTEKLSEYLGETVTVPEWTEPVRTEEIIAEAIPEDVPEEGEEVPKEVQDAVF